MRKTLSLFFLMAIFRSTLQCAIAQGLHEINAILQLYPNPTNDILQVVLDDNDGLNDVWFPQMLSVGKCHVSIFNRWGERIWHTESINDAWLGAYDQGDYFCPDSVYNYLIEVEDMRGQPYSYKGHVLLMR